MQHRRLDQAPVYERDGLRSHVLVDAGELGSQHLVVTWVEVAPGAEQRPHAHQGSEQVYVIVDGTGLMTVAGESSSVGQGDVIAVPPAAVHAITNDGDQTLVYVSATSPPQSMAPSCTAAS